VEVRAVKPLLAKIAVVVAAHHLGPAQHVTATSYSPCSSGATMADGTHTRAGSVAVPRLGYRHHLPLGTLIRMRRRVLGRRYYRVRDFIGSGSELDVWQASCPGARVFGHRHLVYRVVR
jgi:hypothetical protein